MQTKFNNNMLISNEVIFFSSLDNEDLSSLLQYLKRIDQDFTPPLSSRVVLEDYANKLINRAEIFAYKDIDNSIKGFIAFYTNIDEKSAYITLLSIDKNQRGNGLARNLVQSCVDFCKLKHLNSIELEVSLANSSVIKIYEDIGFVLNTTKLNPDKTKTYMVLTL